MSQRAVALCGVSSDFGEIGIRIFFGPDVVQEIGGHERGIGPCKTSPEHHVVSIGVAVLPTDSLKEGRDVYAVPAESDVGVVEISGFFVTDDDHVTTIVGCFFTVVDATASVDVYISGVTGL